MEFAYDLFIEGQWRHIDIDMPVGAGGGFYDIRVDNWNRGRVVRYSKSDENHNFLYRYWQPFIDYDSILTEELVIALFEDVLQDYVDPYEL